MAREEAGVGTAEPMEEAAVPGYPAYHVHYYAPLPAAPPQPPPVLILSRRSRSRAADKRACVSTVNLAVISLVLGLVLFAVWPRSVGIDVRRTELMSIRWEHKNGTLLPIVGLDVKLALELRIRNPNLFGVSYDRIVVNFGYRGDELGRVILEGGQIPALRVVNVNALMDLEGLEVLANAARMLLDIAVGKLPLETSTEFSGNVEFFFIRPHMNAKLGCDIVVRPQDTEILSQFCEYEG